MPKQKRKGKALAQEKHSQRRAHDRYGVALGARVQAEIVAKIQEGKSTPLWRTSNRVTVHDVALEDQTYRVAYDAQRKTIATFLSLDMDRR